MKIEDKLVESSIVVSSAVPANADTQIETSDFGGEFVGEQSEIAKKTDRERIRKIKKFSWKKKYQRKPEAREYKHRRGEYTSEARTKRDRNVQDWHKRREKGRESTNYYAVRVSSSSFFFFFFFPI